MSKKSFGIIGNPVSHTLSPVLHNYWFNKYNITADYSLLNINEKDIEIVVKKIRNKEQFKNKGENYVYRNITGNGKCFETSKETSY